MNEEQQNEVSLQPENLISKIEVARRLRLGTRTVENYMRTGVIPYYKLGRFVHFKWSEVEARLGRVNHSA